VQVTITTIYIAYAVLACLLFALLPLRTAILTSYLGGWLVLPVGMFPHPDGGFTIEVIGNAMPAATMLVNKGWIAPVVTLILAMMKGHRRFLAWRPGAYDLPLVLLCLWPLAAGALAAASSPAPLTASLYLFATWGAPWLLARVCFSDGAGRRELVRGLMVAGLAMIPFALVEAIGGPVLYAALYGAHPFATDGIERYIGYRPLLLFEDGNQYGIVIAMTALAGVAAWRQARDRATAASAAVLLGMALLSQSVGALALLALGLFLLLAPPKPALMRSALIGIGAALLLAAPVYLSGIVPVERLVRHTQLGQQLLAIVRATGRGSIAWRISQDQKVAPLIRRHPLVGSSRWDWWRSGQTRPWGLGLLLIGQFGMIAFALACLTLLLPVGPGVVRGLLPPVTRGLALIVLLSAVDALLNAFVCLPALAAAGAIVPARGRRAEDVPS
jgi:hypothetical protein